MSEKAETAQPQRSPAREALAAAIERAEASKAALALTVKAIALAESAMTTATTAVTTATDALAAAKAARAQALVEAARSGSAAEASDMLRKAQGDLAEAEAERDAAQAALDEVRRPLAEQREQSARDERERRKAANEVLYDAVPALAEQAYAAFQEFRNHCSVLEAIVEGDHRVTGSNALLSAFDRSPGIADLREIADRVYMTCVQGNLGDTAERSLGQAWITAETALISDPDAPLPDIQAVRHGGEGAAA